MTPSATATTNEAPIPIHVLIARRDYRPGRGRLAHGPGARAVLPRGRGIVGRPARVRRSREGVRLGGAGAGRRRAGRTGRPGGEATAPRREPGRVLHEPALQRLSGDPDPPRADRA